MIREIVNNVRSGENKLEFKARRSCFRRLEHAHNWTVSDTVPRTLRRLGGICVWCLNNHILSLQPLFIHIIRQPLILASLCVFYKAPARRSLINFYEKFQCSNIPSSSASRVREFLLKLIFDWMLLRAFHLRFLLSIRYVLYLCTRIFIHISLRTLLRHQLFMNNSLHTNFYASSLFFGNGIGWTLRSVRENGKNVNPDECTISRIIERYFACMYISLKCDEGSNDVYRCGCEL